MGDHLPWGAAAESQPRTSRREMLTRAAVAGAVWTVPTILSVKAAAAESAPSGGCVTTVQECDGSHGPPIISAIVDATNNCGFDVLIDSTLVGPGETIEFEAFDSTIGQPVFVPVFRADAQGQPTGPPIQQIRIIHCFQGG